jgi:hypothetical protein
MLRQVDDAQLRAWQHVANHLNWKVGISQFTAARFAIVIYAASNLTTFINKPSVLAAFPAILVYGQELLPGKVGLVAGLFFGFAFGIAAVKAAMVCAYFMHLKFEKRYVWWRM